jgi:endonuclease/exonuclease/phosphatase family metal-dependent hydrolase
VVVSYNIHRCIGRDQRYAPMRIARLLRQLNPDIAALQEVETRFADAEGRHQLETMSHQTGLRPVAGPTMRHSRWFYGNALLTRFPVVESRPLDISVRGAEPRGAIDVDVDTGCGVLRVIATHLGLNLRQRRQQVRWIVEALETRQRAMTVLVGDFNDWIPHFGAVKQLDQRFGGGRRLLTYPAALPLLPLDRIWVDPAQRIDDITTVRSALARQASDHLPVVARMRLHE